MRRITTVGAATFALALMATPAVAGDDQEQTPDYGVTTTTLTENDKCGTFTVTWDNPTQWTFFGDYEMGQQDGQADAVTGEKISEGPLAGESFGKTYNQTPVPAGESVTEKIELPPKYAGKGEVTIKAWIKRGPEQHSFSKAEPITITACEPDTTEPTPTPPPTDGEQPPADDENDDKSPAGDDEPTTDDDDDQDEADEDGIAPTPEPQEAHIAVTG